MIRPLTRSLTSSLTDSLTSSLVGEEGGVPATAMRSEDNNPILSEDGEYMESEG